MPNQTEIRQAITRQIVEALTTGTLPPWRKPWRCDRNAGSHANVVSKRPYTGVNPLILELAACRYGFESRWWATFMQWEQMGGQVMRRPHDVPPGQWGTQIVFCKPVTKDSVSEDCDETDTYFVLRSYSVFNIDQVRGDKLDGLRVGNGVLDTQELNGRFENADGLIEATKADIRYGGNEAFYDRTGDFIQMPHRHQFSLPEFHETVFHELVHWTEPSHRLNWDWDREGYGMGELIAEMGGCFLATEVGLPTAANLSNHIAYVGSWLNGMNGDPKFIFRAATQATKAVDFILSFSSDCTRPAGPIPA